MGIPIRKLHRALGVAGALFLALAAVTGLLWAYGPSLYLKSGYLQKREAMPSVPLANVTMTPQDAIRIASHNAPTEFQTTSVVLRSDLGHALYEVTGGKDGKGPSTLIDAMSGKVLSPLTEELATEVARQYVEGGKKIKSVVAQENYRLRSGKVISAFQVFFDGPENTEIIVDRNSGMAVEELDRARRFQAWVTRLHQLQIFGFKRGLTFLPAITALAILASGLALWLQSRTKKTRNSPIV